MTTENKWFAMSRKTDAEGVKASEAEISIYDNIGGWGVTANDFIDELKALGDDVETINLRIASGGGSIVEGNTIYNALQRHGARVVTHIDSIAASMASVIAMAGDEVRMAENALLMIHNPWTMSMGGAEQLRKDADLLDKMEANIRLSYGRSNLSDEELDAAMEAETYYTASEALEAGFIDAIDGANLAAANIADMESVKEFEKLPQAKLDAIKIDCQAKQIEQLSARLEERQDQITQLEAFADTLNKTIEAAKEEKAEMIELHAKELDEAKIITEEAISAAAAEQLAEVGHDPVESNASEEGSNGKSPKEMTPKEFWDEYERLDKAGDYDGKNKFYAENKHVLA